MPDDGSRGADNPSHQQHPGRDQHHRAVIAVEGEEDDDKQADDGDVSDRDAGNAGGNRGELMTASPTRAASKASQSAVDEA